MAKDSRTFKFRFTGETDGLEKATDKVGKDMEGLGGKLSGSAKKIAGAIAAGFVVDKLIGFGTELYNIGDAADMLAAKAGVVFGDQIGMVEEWAEANAGAMGLTAGALTGLTANMADLLVPMGATREEAANMSTDVNELAGALAMWSGGTRSTAEVSEILSKALLGERDALTSLGIKISQAEVDQRALALAQADGRDAVTDLDKAMATQALIMEKSTDAQTAWADGTFAGSQKANELTAKIAEMKEALGLQLLPIVNNVQAFLVDKMIPALEQFGQWLWPKLQAAHEALTGFWEEKGPAIIGFVLAVKDGAIALGEGFLEAWNLYIAPSVAEIGDAVSELWGQVQGIFAQFNGGTEGVGVNWEKVGKVIGFAVGLIIKTIANIIKIVAEVVGAVSKTIPTFVDAFRDARGAVQWVVDKLQSLYDLFIKVKDKLAAGLSIPTPSWPSPPGWLTNLGFHSGTNSVPGAPGANVPAMLQAGERVLSVAQTRQADRSGMGGGTLVVNAYGTTGREMVAEIERAVRDGARAVWLDTAGVTG